MNSTEDFEELRERAIEGLADEDVVSLYVGLVHEEGRDAYYFANDVDDERLQEMAATQLGMLTRVLATKSDLSLEEVTDLALERADEMGLQS
ncbi:hypothetical protein [Halalkalicoccus jeotgali]|uniref:DUF8113 domain-containing protein n=1 Tax=Halalkalicoccus jeotgali (strain DSM 18796 / CECT 7217 / JCM 14584 / KCTC 4019 / B3) TaxID=795797 RepID=D8J9R7_HALJB|nr:hypothetical protein [Halalkalicoccus jeotgali]ADJ16406.1 hypothetical protein HacjB3_15135 [Halalkalicoccus jeotgali B3]ELY37140.1 hypothetical protein C497_10363 [Halalkalicoccus jeotgali B3]